MAVEIETQDKLHNVANQTNLGGGGVIASPADIVSKYHYWGVSVFSTQAGQLVIEYRMTNGAWRAFPAINIAANTPFDQVYRKTRAEYKVTYTDTSLVASVVDIVTVMTH